MKMIIDFVQEYLNKPDVMRTPLDEIMFTLLIISVIVIGLGLLFGFIYVKLTIKDLIKKIKNKKSEDADDADDTEDLDGEEDDNNERL